MNFYYSQRAFLDEIKYLTQNNPYSYEYVSDILKLWKFRCKVLSYDGAEDTIMLEVSKFGRKTVLELISY